MAVAGKPKLGDILVLQGVISQEQLQEALKAQKETSFKLGRQLVELGYVTEDSLVQALASQFSLETISLEEYEFDPEILAKIPANIAQKYMLIPLSEEFNTLRVAISNPLNIQAFDDLRLMLGKEVDVVLAKESEIEQKVSEYYGQGEETLDSLVSELSADGVEVVAEDEEEDISEADIESAPVIKLVNLIILQAIKEGASDIHVEPYEKTFRVRFRIDGVLHEQNPPPPKRLQNAIISRLKIMADLNIAERRLPQDGRIKIKLAKKEIDLRVSALPTLYGESVVMRILDRSSVMITLEQIGFSDHDLNVFKKIIHKPNGIFLVTGPTGSGKTTTLYGALNEINEPDFKIITCEDPVEYQLEGINQVQIRSKIGLTFAASLRSILRQDPDVVMIGEIRDIETGQIAIQAALTGHLVFSTLHTNDAPGAITRLLDMGIEPFLITSSIEGVLAQRLVRKICPECKEEYKPTSQEIADLAMPNEDFDKIKLYKGAGCDNCNNTGYKGRMGIFELFVMQDRIRELVIQRASSTEIKQMAVKEGMLTLRMDGWDKAKQGETTISEVLRVTQADDVEDVIEV